MRLAAEQGFEGRIDTVESLKKATEALYTNAALFASMRIVDRIEEYGVAPGKQVLFLLSHVSAGVGRTLREGERFDRTFVEYLEKKSVPYVDLLEVHMRAHFNACTELLLGTDTNAA